MSRSRGEACLRLDALALTFSLPVNLSVICNDCRVLLSEFEPSAALSSALDLLSPHMLCKYRASRVSMGPQLLYFGLVRVSYTPYDCSTAIVASLAIFYFYSVGGSLFVYI